MKLLWRIERLEARTPKAPKRVILVWVEPEGPTTKAADTHPELPDERLHDNYLHPYTPGGGPDNPANETVESLAPVRYYRGGALAPTSFRTE